MREPGTGVPAWLAKSKIQTALRTVLSLMAVAVLTAVLGGCSMISHQQSYMVTHGPVAKAQYDLFMVTVYVTVAIFVVVTSALLYAVFRYRDTSGKDETLPHQTHGNPLIEGSLGVVSALLLVLIAVPTVQGIFYTNDVPPDQVNAGAQPPATPTATASASTDATSTASPSDTPSPPTVIPPGPIKVTVTGHQWWWQFDYPDIGVTTADELHVPQGRPITFLLDSADVIHSFWAPQLAGKVDVIPGQENHMWFQGDDLGIFYGQCTEFCGTDHALMDFKVYVDKPADFQTWVDHQKADALDAPDSDPDAKAGEDVITTVCAACHTVRGTGAGGSIGPDLTHLKSRDKIIADWYENNDKNLEMWLNDPQSVKAESKMILPRKLTPDEIKHVIKYLDTLK